MSGAASLGPVAAAGSLLRTLGGDTVVVRFAAPPAGGDGEELGQPAPEFRDVELRPALVRPAMNSGTGATRATVLVDARAAEEALATGDVRAAMSAATSVIADGRNWCLQAVERRSVFGRAYLYRLLLQAANGRAA